MQPYLIRRRRPAELHIILQLRHRRALPAHGTVLLPSAEPHCPEPAGQPVKQQQALRVGGAEAGTQQSDRLQRLQRADDAGNDPQDAAVRAVGDRLRWRRAGEEAPVAGPARVTGMEWGGGIREVA